MTRVLISLGSNIDKERNLPAAIQALRSQDQIEVLAVSSIYLTAAIGSKGHVATQPSFHNAAVLVETSLDAVELRTVLRGIEAQLGRMRSADKYAPRPIDLDIALYGQEVIDLDGSQIPDPDIERFAHVVVPLAELCPAWVYPRTGATLDQIASHLENNELEIVNYEYTSAQ